MIKKYLPALSAALGRLADRKVMKAFILDVAVILLMVFAAYLLAGRPAVKPAAPADSRPPAAKASAKPPPSKMDAAISRPIVSDEAAKDIKARNIFIESGMYADADGQMMPANPYTLIAVLQGKKHSAVFRDYQGKVLTLSAGEKLMDGFVIARIDAMSVRLQRQDEQKTLQLFNPGANVSAPALDKDGAVPKNLYTLIGILGGKEKKAVFKDYKGSVSILKAGATLLDGAVIVSINPTTVQIKKDGEKSELKIFSFRADEQALRKK